MAVRPCVRCAADGGAHGEIMPNTVHDAGLQVRARQQLLDQVDPAFAVEGLRDAQGGQAAVQAVQVLRHAERVALVDGHDFVDAVAENEAAIQDGDLGLVHTQELTVEIHLAFARHARNHEALL
ncbi:hypothetical protein G6F65_021747 [Rhizopus arrhizus]|nr:hypothetical protein G6F65_021747 [Rhizopus arrhizus]